MESNDVTVRPIDANALRKAAETSIETTDAFQELIDKQPTLAYTPVNPARWEKAKFEGSNTPYWRCSACKDACFPAPDGLDRVYYCPQCGAFTGGNVDQ